MSRLTIAACIVVCFAAFAGLDGSHVLPAEHEAIQYAKAPVDNVVSRLQKRVAEGTVRLAYDPETGYLRSVLKELKLPHSSQVLVFSKTSFQAPRISPRTPRALYFNEEAAVGFVRGGDVLELSAVDPKQGIIFYSLDQEQIPKPQLERQDQCLQCHNSGATLGVPGLIVRSVFAERTGMPVFSFGSFISDHRSPLAERWGGWYVTGTHGGQHHMGNSFADPKGSPETFDKRTGAETTDLRKFIDPGAYLTPHSDAVALLVLEHQTRMTNLIVRVGWETRMAIYDRDSLNRALGEPEGTQSEGVTRRIDNAVEELLRYMLFTDEAPLGGKVVGTSSFAAEYTQGGKRDKQGRSLRDLDLQTRLLRYPCSPMIYSPGVHSLPDAAKNRLFKRLSEVLGGRDQSREFARLSSQDRSAIGGILADTGIDVYQRNRSR